jgi:hypothetical protein
VGYDSDGNPIFPSGISAADLIASTNALNTPSQIVTVTPQTTTFYNPATGQTQTAPTSGQSSSMSGILLLAAGLALVVMMTR